MSQNDKGKAQALKDFEQEFQLHRLDELRGALDHALGELLPYTRSHIEARFLAALVAYGPFEPSAFKTPDYANLDNPAAGVRVTAQWKILQYTADFAVVAHHPNGHITRLVIECDGHNFHERTKEQAKHDRSRDRVMLREGWTVIRFTGSEIHNDVEGCVQEVCEMFSDETVTDHFRGRTQ